jgi:hypothetical protein
MKLKKGVNVFFLAFILLFSINFVFAQNETTTPTGIDKGYSCLIEKLGDNCEGTSSTKQASFNLLAIAYDSSQQNTCKTTLNQKKKTNCWGETDTSPCDVKSTALATIALSYIQENTDDSVNYLLEKRFSETGLIWFLQIDSTNRTECDINGETIIIEEHKKLSGNPPSGLKKAYDDNWLEIEDESKEYIISCIDDFTTSLSYQKPGSNIYHILSDTNTAAGFDSITEKVESYCLSSSSTCNYEDTLWGALALAKSGKDISSLLPYLLSMSEDGENKKYIPSAFLYSLTADDEYEAELRGLQKSSGYWDESQNKFYDTALSLLALQNLDITEVDKAKRTLLKDQKENGCWQSDTAFILHAAWPKSPSISAGSGLSRCEDFNYNCVGLGQCDSSSTLDNYYCSSSLEVCCSVKPIEESCFEKEGAECTLNQICDGDTVSASDTNSCCLGSCIEDVNECLEATFNCRDSCSDSEIEKSGYNDFCDLQVCCGPKPKKEGGGMLIIVLLIILIILVILAIVFRKQLKTWLFRFRSKVKTSKAKPPGRPPQIGFPVGRAPPRRVPRRGPPGRTPRRGPPKSRDSDFDETMKKLRDMTK